MAHYNRSFFRLQGEGSRSAANLIVPVINELFHPVSVIDVGCGTGVWLQAFKKLGKAEHLHGVDGDYINESTLEIPAEMFAAFDLNEFYDTGRVFDVAISLEVAEHLPDASADNFVKTLVNASRIVLFSAALPGQGGTHHENEQYPEYWAQRFAVHGYVPIDYLRKMFWNNSKIDFWYRQNIILYLHSSKLPDYPELTEAYQQTDPDFLTRIHPELIKFKQAEINRLKNPLKNFRHQLYLAKQKLRGL